MDLINAEAQARGVKVHIVIDIVHVLEYLWGAGHGLHASGDKTIETWVARTARTVLAGDCGKAAAAIRAAAEQAGITVGHHKGIDDFYMALPGLRIPLGSKAAFRRRCSA
jgi:hypothetical protein